MKATALTQKLLQPTLRGVILLVLDQVRGETLDALGEERDLHRRAPRVVRRLLKLGDVRDSRSRALIRGDDLERTALVRVRAARRERAGGVRLDDCVRREKRFRSGQIRGLGSDATSHRALQRRRASLARLVHCPRATETTNARRECIHIVVARRASPRARIHRETTRAAASRAPSRRSRNIGPSATTRRARARARRTHARWVNRDARRDARRVDRTHLCERRRRTSSWKRVTSSRIRGGRRGCEKVRPWKH